MAEILIACFALGSVLLFFSQITRDEEASLVLAWFGVCLLAVDFWAVVVILGGRVVT